MKNKIKIGTTSFICHVFIQNSSVTTGAGLTGLAFNSAGLKAYYMRAGASADVAITLATISTLGTFATGGFKEVDATNMPGVYEFHIPNAALAAGANRVVVILTGATNMVPCALEIELDACDYTDAAAFGLSRLDAAVSSRMATFTLPTNFSSQAIDASGRLDLSKVNGSAINNLISGRVDANVGVNSDKTGYSLIAAQNPSMDSGTAQAGAASTITLRSGASATNSFYNNLVIAITSGTGAGQANAITGYVGSTKVATVAIPWATQPDNTSVYTILADVQCILGSDGKVLLSNNAQTGVTIPTVTNITNGVIVTTNNDKTGYTASTVSDKTGYALTTGEHSNIVSDVEAGLTAQGYTTTRAGYLDTLNGLVNSIWSAAVAGFITLGSIGQAIVSDFTTLITGVTVTTNNDKTGYSLNLAQAISKTFTSETLGEALYASRTQAFGKWVVSGTSLTLYAADGTTVVHTFTLDSAISPTQRV